MNPFPSVRARHGEIILGGKLAARRADCAPLAGKSTLNRLDARMIIIEVFARGCATGLEARPMPARRGAQLAALTVGARLAVADG